MNDFQRAGGNTAVAEPEPEVLTGEVVDKGQVIHDPKRLAEIKDESKAAIDPFVEAAKSITIENAEDAEGATEVLAEITRRKKALETERKKLAAPINAAKDAVQNMFNGLKAPLDEARAILEPKLIAHQEAEAKRIREENAKRERELLEKQKAEQARIDAEREAAVKAQKEAEAAARAASEAMAEQADPEAEAKALAAAEEARKAAEATTAARDARPTFELAERDEAKATIKTTGGSFTVKKVWTAEVVDESQIPREFLTVDTKKINAVVKAGVREIAGVRIYEKSQGSVNA